MLAYGLPEAEQFPDAHAPQPHAERFQVRLVFAGKVVHLATDTEYHKPEPAESPGGETTWIDDLSRF